MKKIESLRALGIFTVASFAVWATVAVLRLPAVLPSVPKPRGPLVEFKKVHVVAFSHTRRSWTLRARAGVLERDRDTLSITDCNGTLFPLDADPVAFASPVARYRRSVQVLQCEKGAQFVAADNLTFRVPTLTWTGRENIISASGPVTATGAGVSISGHNLRLNLKTEELLMDNGEARIRLASLEKLGEGPR
jgi:hypothetical protein